MEFRKVVMITLYARQQKRHRCIEQSFGLFWERARAGWYGRLALKHVNYHMWNESPVQVWCMIQGAWGWCTGMNQRNGMGKQVGGRFRMGNTCTPMAYSSQCMAKTVQYCKVNKLKNNNNNKVIKWMTSAQLSWALELFKIHSGIVVTAGERLKMLPVP